MAIQSDDEARRAAEAMIADLASGEADAAAAFAELYANSPSDTVWIGRYLAPIFTDAIERLEAGDTSPETLRLIACVAVYDEMSKASETDRVMAKAKLEAERRIATLSAIRSAPDVAKRMTGVGLHGVPLPDDVIPDGDFLSTRVASAEGLMAFYIEHLRATGWTLDLDWSRPLLTRAGWSFHRSATSRGQTCPAGMSKC